MRENHSLLRAANALAEAERKLLACIHCGLCLEACPTYVHTGDENDGPRGRIYLMRAVEEGRLAASSDAFTRHIERCLGCRACESACPAGVEYGQLLEAARSDIVAAQGEPRGLTSRLLRFVLRRVWLRPARLRFAFAAARLVRDARLASLLLKSKVPRLFSPQFEFALALLESSRDDASNPKGNRASSNAEGIVGAGLVPARVLSPPSGQGQALPLQTLGTHQVLSDALSFETNDESRVARLGLRTARVEVQLFTGCVTEGLFARVNRATERVLGANGCAAHAPRGQVCCGALHAHAGDLEGARELARRNVEAFDTAPGDAPDSSSPIVTNAGGCGAMLASYGHLLARDEEYAERAARFSLRVRDVSQQLEATGIREGVELERDNGATTYDASCHLLHGQRASEAPRALLGAIPGLDFSPLADADVCCGGAGVYNLTEPELSGRVLAEKLRCVAESGARVLATGNPGCHMQIGAGARLAGMNLRVCHPVELLDESYRRAGFYVESDAEG